MVNRPTEISRCMAIFLRQNQHDFTAHETVPSSILEFRFDAIAMCYFLILKWRFVKLGLNEVDFSQVLFN